jgi:hypothetical protein
MDIVGTTEVGNRCIFELSYMVVMDMGHEGWQPGTMEYGILFLLFSVFFLSLGPCMLHCMNVPTGDFNSPCHLLTVAPDCNIIEQYKSLCCF